MDNQFNKDINDNGYQSEQIREGFLCCVCLDLLYKPIVLACGHVSCFWCVHKSMSGVHRSHCPLCRHSYGHFPSICEMLHFLLLKMYPITYKAIETQILEYEMKENIFSPRLNKDVHSLSSEGESSDHTCSGLPSSSNSQDNPISDPSLTNTVERFSDMERLDTFLHSQNNDKINRKGTFTFKENKLQRESSNTTSGQLSIADVLCTSCHQLLFHPVVLNCGHACCKTCIALPVDAALKCSVCENPHPGRSLKVFLELDNLLKEKFPDEYALRKGDHQKHAYEQRALLEDGKGAQKSSSQKAETLQQDDSQTTMTHFGVGCDYCGMFPIIGDRYKCLDCVEDIGFDLCGECYKTRRKLPGRFSQQHTAEHQFTRKLYPSMNDIESYLFLLR